jgi:mono/diheme cytochrome c family protein
VIALWSILACGEAPSTPPASSSPSNVAGATYETPAHAGPYGVGRAATADEIAAWDKDVDPGWNGLPTGSGTVDAGKALYAQKCLACHGPDARGGKGWPGPLIVASEPKSGFDQDFSIPKSIGNYWPHASTLFDYVRRSMPQNAPGSLTDDETYALVAFLLAENQVVPGDFVANTESLKQVVMPSEVRFERDDRATTTQFR